MVESDPPLAKFVGYVRSFVESMGEDDVQVEMGWFYRACDIEQQIEDLPGDWVKRAAKLGPVPGLSLTPEQADGGRFKELCLSNHSDKVSINCILHPVKVWFLREDDLLPLLVPSPLPPPAASAQLSGAAAAAYAHTLLPGFVCRRYWDRNTNELTWPLSKVLKHRVKHAGDPWVLDDLSELLKRSEAEREEFKRKWQQRMAAGAARQQQGQGSGQGRGPGSGQGQGRGTGQGQGRGAGQVQGLSKKRGAGAG
ncbi:hypothetical protein HYH03_004743 [Edaphochlamys debaryana]|uniref:BAH domain-containing protein n=1 Tax=Edaphochlamys debaryana TaxID=47281 RepID=A0A835Y9C2_9CHLO|nr:hypothetical protein HYH03_004743 [Edaphochlamys debaryana]|eukprot:KAG2497153.1 hypothetical protein HYH03_004743 [Edaphochlamys debaryana]